MALKDRLHRLTAPMSELDQEKLKRFCAGHPHCSTIGDAMPRQQVTLVGFKQESLYAFPMQEEQLPFRQFDQLGS